MEPNIFSMKLEGSHLTSDSNVTEPNQSAMEQDYTGSPKKDRADVNSQELIVEKFQAMKEEMIKRKETNAVGGANHARQGEIIPN